MTVIQGTGSNTARVFIVIYDLQTRGTDYTPFFEALKQHSQNWCHYLTHAWLIKTTLTEKTLSQALFPHMTENDRLLILEVHGIGDGWMPKDVWEWLVEHNGGQQLSLFALTEAYLKATLPKPPLPPLGKLLPPPPKKRST